jgi:7-cyano-7-deazaguanine reductase
MNTPEASPLGKPVARVDRYDPGLLFPIPRAPARAALGIGARLPFAGVDIWNAYELSWLDARGKPRVALAEFRVPADSPAIIESKSFKLYLNGFARERVASAEALAARLRQDLSAAAGAPVAVALVPPARFGSEALAELEGESLDELDLELDDYGPPNPDHLRVAGGGAETRETLRSDLLRSNCPVTGQPDWASVQVCYAGPRLDRAGLLRYLVSFREHAGFHEQCVERIFMDLRARCAPRELSVYARYTRRGGLDINPWRGSTDARPSNPRGARQ